MGADLTRGQLCLPGIEDIPVTVPGRLPSRKSPGSRDGRPNFCGLPDLVVALSAGGLFTCPLVFGVSVMGVLDVARFSELAATG